MSHPLEADKLVNGHHFFGQRCVQHPSQAQRDWFFVGEHAVVKVERQQLADGEPVPPSQLVVRILHIFEVHPVSCRLLCFEIPQQLTRFTSLPRVGRPGQQMQASVCRVLSGRLK